jgi:hypothetical protein
MITTIRRQWKGERGYRRAHEQGQELALDIGRCSIQRAQGYIFVGGSFEDVNELIKMVPHVKAS